MTEITRNTVSTDCVVKLDENDDGGRAHARDAGSAEVRARQVAQRVQARIGDGSAVAVGG